MSQNNSQFPDTYSNFSHAELTEIYAAGPERLRAVVKDLSLADLSAYPQAGKWSIKEIVLHLADAEIMGAARIRQTFAEPGSTFAVYDQDVWAREFDYQNYDTESYYSYLSMFDALRLASTTIFQRRIGQSRRDIRNWES
ncbi:hypothetical protein GWN42_09460 [candidate division KSB1 bacterium]|nr:hypothetical protein [candidate division KSB1 bacterium]